MKRHPRHLLAATVLAFATTLAGCRSTDRPPGVYLDGTAFPGLKPYQVVTVTPFALKPGLKCDLNLGRQMTEAVATALRSDFGQVFQNVRTGMPLGQDNELVVLGTVEEYEPGRDGGAGGVAGIGAPKFNGQLRLQDASDTEDLANGNFAQLRQNAGMSDDGKTLPELLTNTEAAIAFNIARAKGWKPAGTP